MKKILIIFILSVGMCPYASSQNLVKDFFKSQSQKGNRIDTLNTDGINDTILYVDPNDASTHRRIATLIDSSDLQTIRKYIFLLRQDYCLFDKKKKKYYGYEGMEMFGSTYSIGLRCNNFNILMDEAIHPWEYDDNYNSFKNQKLEPVITDSYFSLIDGNDSSYYVKTESALTATRIVKENYVYQSAPWVSNQEGFAINTSDTCKTGIIVWVINEKSSSKDEHPKVELKSTLIKGEMYGSINVIPPVNSSKILGGIYLTKTTKEDFPYLLTGVVTQRDEKWTLQFPFKNFHAERTKDQPKIGKLTEVKKSLNEIKK